ncbi:MAG: hypothetical protein VX529_07020 [Pseudomonadota bacterium]|nr:hypothetical protein [Pseudomonadota bacterium]
MRLTHNLARAFTLDPAPASGGDKTRHEFWLGIFASFITSYALLLAAYQLHDLMQDDAAGAFSGVMNTYNSYYGEITSRHGILETLFRHVSADVSVQTSRLLVVVFGVFPACFSTYYVAVRFLNVRPIGAMVAVCIPFLLGGQVVIPFSYNSSYPVFDLLSLSICVAAVCVGSRSDNLEFVGAILLSLAFLVSEAMNNAPFLTPSLFVFVLFLRWRSVTARFLTAFVLVGGTLKVVYETFVLRMDSTPGSREAFSFSDILYQFWSNIVDTTHSVFGLGVVGAVIFVFLSSVAFAGSYLSWVHFKDGRSFIVTVFSLSLFYIPLLGFAVAAEGFQLRYAFYSHVGLMLLFGFWISLLSSALLWPEAERSGGGEMSGVVRFSKRISRSALILGALSLTVVAAYLKSQPSPAAERITMQLERLSTYFQRPPARAIRAARTHQYLVMTDGGELRSSLLPLATAFGYIQLVTANAAAFGWIGPADACGDPFREDWSLWGRSKLPGALSLSEPMWVVGANGRFGGVRELGYLLASDVDNPSARLDGARWRLYAIGDRAASLVAEGEGELSALAAMRERGIDPQLVALSCGLGRSASAVDRGVIVHDGDSIEAEFAGEAWSSTGFGPPSAFVSSEGLVLRPNEHAISRKGLSVQPGQTVTLSYRAEMLGDSGAGVPMALRIGPVGRSADGSVVSWWSPEDTEERFRHALADGRSEITGARTVVVPEGVETMHIAFRGPVTEIGAELPVEILVTEARLVLEAAEQ